MNTKWWKKRGRRKENFSFSLFAGFDFVLRLFDFAKWQSRGGTDLRHEKQKRRRKQKASSWKFKSFSAFPRLFAAFQRGVIGLESAAAHQQRKKGRKENLKALRFVTSLGKNVLSGMRLSVLRFAAVSALFVATSGDFCVGKWSRRGKTRICRAGDSL